MGTMGDMHKFTALVEELQSEIGEKDETNFPAARLLEGSALLSDEILDTA